MPFFSRHSADAEDDTVPVEEPVAEEEPRKRHGLFGRNRSPSPSPSNATASTRMTGATGATGDRANGNTGGVWRRSTDAGSNASGGRRSILHRSFGGGNTANAVEMDPSIVAARERVMTAEGAERDADRALEAARARVREAREEVRKLEIEAREEARRAKIKAYHAKEVSKRGSALGRHGA